MGASLTRRARAWFDAACARAARENPAAWALLARASRHPGRVLVPVSAALAGCFGAVIADGDAGWFRDAGTGMLSGGFLNVFSDGGLQLGPLYLLLLGVATRMLGLVHVTGVPALFLLAAAQGAALTGGGIWTAGRAARVVGADQLPAKWAVGASMGLAGLVAEAIGNGHPEEMLVALLLANAALMVQVGRGWSAAVLVGLAAGVKQWGILGAGTLASRAGCRQILLRGSVAAVVMVAVYGPFYVWGQVDTYQFAWGISASGTSLLGLIGRWTGLSDWGLRVVQGAAAGLAGVATGLRRSGSPMVAVIVALSVRLLLDPLRLTYYSGPLLLLLLLWGFCSRSTQVVRLRAVLLLAVPLTVLAPYLVPSAILGPLGTVALLLVTAAVLGLDRHDGPVVQSSSPLTHPEVEAPTSTGR